VATERLRMPVAGVCAMRTAFWLSFQGYLLACWKTCGPAECGARSKPTPHSAADPQKVERTGTASWGTGLIRCVRKEEADDMPALSESEQVEWTAQFMTFRICRAITPKNQDCRATVDL
jgi:hypothetical protein